MTEENLFSSADAERIEQQSRELVGRWPKIQVLPGQLSVVADYASPYARKVWGRLQLILLAGLTALTGYLAWKTPVLDSYASLAYPYVVGYARTATEAIILAYQRSHGFSLSVADRGAVGIRLSRRNDNGLFVWRSPDEAASELRENLNGKGE